MASSLEHSDCSDEDYSSDTLSCLEEHWETSTWEKSLLSSLNIIPRLRSPDEFRKPCDLILEASLNNIRLNETLVIERINEVKEIIGRVKRLGKEIERNPPVAFSSINTSNVENFTVGSTFPPTDFWFFSDTLQQIEPEFCKKFSNHSSDFMDDLQMLVRCCHRRRNSIDTTDEDQGSRKRRMSQEVLDSSDVPERYYEQLFVSFAKMCGVVASTMEVEKQSMQMKGRTVESMADILLVDLSVRTPKQRMLAVVEVKKPKKEEEGGFKKMKRETRRTFPDCFTHYLKAEPELIGEHGGELLLFSPLSIFNDNGVIGIIVHGTIVTFSWLKITHNQYMQISQKKIPTTAEIKYSREYNYFSEEGRVEVIKAIFMLSLIGKLKYEFPKDCDFN